MKLPLAGTKFHRLTFLKDAGVDRKVRRWLMVCICGTRKVVDSQSVKHGHTKSCGCQAREWNAGPKYRRYPVSMTNSPTYRSWNSMKFRCKSPTQKTYFGKVSVCERWNNFANFLADMGERPPRTTIDRKNGTKGYYPGNCRWATHRQQALNKSTSRLITFRRETKSLSEWSEETGLGRVVITNRLRLGWSVRKALTTSIDITRRHKTELNGHFSSPYFRLRPE